MIQLYRIKPAIVQAVKYTGNVNELRELANGSIIVQEFTYNTREPRISLKTVNGVVRVRKGYYVIRHNEEFTICKPREFQRLYETV